MQTLKSKLVFFTCAVMFIIFLILSFKIDDVMLNQFYTAMALVTGLYSLNKI